MRIGRVLVTCAFAWALLAGTGRAQGVQTGLLEGSVIDTDGLAVPGVVVSVSSPALQGTRSGETDLNGRFVIRGLPPGAYTVVFELSGLERVERSVQVELGRMASVDAQMQIAGIDEQVTVVATAPSEVVTPTAGANYVAEEIDALATPRTLFGITELAPGLTDNTPNRNQVSIAGAFAYDNVFLLDGVDINDNLLGDPDDLFIEDAVEETQVLTSGISAEYGRFTGGVVNAVTKSGGNDFSGSMRVNFSNPAWRDETPFEKAQGTVRPSSLDEFYEGTFGGPVVLNRLWFFSAGRFENQTTSMPLPQTGIQFEDKRENRRAEIKLTGSVTPSHMLQGGYFRNDTDQTRVTFPFSIDPRVSVTPTFPNDRLVATYRGILSPGLFGELQYSRKRAGFENRGGTSGAIVDSPFITRTQTFGHYNAPYFDSTDPENRDNQQVTGNVSHLVSTRGFGSHDLKGGFEVFTGTNRGGNSQSSTGYVFYADYKTDAAGRPVFDGQGRLVPVFAPGVTLLENWLPTRGAQIDIRTTSLYFQDRWAASRHWAFDLGVRYERVRSEATGDIVGVDTDTIVPRLAATYDVKGNGRFVLQSTYGHYAGKYNEAQFSRNTNVGNPSVLIGVYTGAGGEGLDFAQGMSPASYQTVVGMFPTANVFFADDLSSPIVKEFTLSAGSQVGRGHVKAIYSRRSMSNFIEDFITLDTGATTIVRDGRNFGTFANQMYRNTNEPKRDYQALQLVGRYQLTNRWSTSGNWTIQLENDGTFEGELANQPAIASEFGNYPDVFPVARYAPDGRLDEFQRHKVRWWTIYGLDLGRFGDADVSFLYRYDSPLSYSLVARGVRLTPAQRALAAQYASAPSSGNLFFGPRGSERFEGTHLVDMAVHYSIPVVRSLRPWVKFEVRNLFNDDTLTGWNTTISPDVTGPVDALGLPTTYVRGSRFGQATANTHYPIPREFFISAGFRF